MLDGQHGLDSFKVQEFKTFAANCTLFIESLDIMPWRCVFGLVKSCRYFSQSNASRRISKEFYVAERTTFFCKLSSYGLINQTFFLP